MFGRLHRKFGKLEMGHINLEVFKKFQVRTCFAFWFSDSYME